MKRDARALSVLSNVSPPCRRSQSPSRPTWQLLVPLCVVGIVLWLSRGELGGESVCHPPPALLRALCSSAGRGVLLEPREDVCSAHLLLLVFSTPENKLRRHLIRRTWGSLPRVLGRKLMLVFVLGVSADRVTADSIHEKQGQLLVVKVQEDYHTLTAKHFLALKWSLDRCGSAGPTLVKVDDDVFVDPFQLVQYMDRLLGVQAPPPEGVLLCNVLPAERKSQGSPVRRQGRWAVRQHDYPGSHYPPYCSGLLYVTSLATAGRLVRAAERAIQQEHSCSLAVWVDDVAVTGVMARAAGVTHLAMNLRYSFQPQLLRRWAEGEEEERPFDYTVTHLGPSVEHWEKTAEKAWLKTMRQARHAQT